MVQQGVNPAPGRMLSHFKIVWRLVYGLLTAGQTILSMTMLIAVSLFIFACVAVESLGIKQVAERTCESCYAEEFAEFILSLPVMTKICRLIAKDPELKAHPTIGPLVTHNFLGLNRSLLTLLQFVTLDDIADVYYPLVLERPYLCAFFFPILIFISIGLMNLVTAALVENETWFMTFMTWNLV